MIRTLRHTARIWLRLLLVLQVTGLLGHASAWGASPPRADRAPLAALSQALGYDVALCHHGHGDPKAPDPGSSDDCCAGGLCHCVSHVFDTAAAATHVTPRVAIDGGGLAPPPGLVPIRAPQTGATSARGPPVLV